MIVKIRLDFFLLVLFLYPVHLGKYFDTRHILQKFANFFCVSKNKTAFFNLPYDTTSHILMFVFSNAHTNKVFCHLLPQSNLITLENTLPTCTHISPPQPLLPP